MRAEIEDVWEVKRRILEFKWWTGKTKTCWNCVKLFKNKTILNLENWILTIITSRTVNFQLFWLLFTCWLNSIANFWSRKTTSYLWKSRNSTNSKGIWCCKVLMQNCKYFSRSRCRVSKNSLFLIIFLPGSKSLDKAVSFWSFSWRRSKSL